MPDLKVGERLVLTHGPWASTWEVVEVVDAGARLTYTGDAPEFVGFPDSQRPMRAPNGNLLVEGRDQDWVGRAHFHSVQRVTARPVGEAGPPGSSA